MPASAAPEEAQADQWLLDTFGGGGRRPRGRRAAGGGGRAAAAGKARCQQGCRQKAGDQFFHIENSFTSFFFPAPGPTLFLP